MFAFHSDGLPLAMGEIMTARIATTINVAAPRPVRRHFAPDALIRSANSITPTITPVSRNTNGSSTASGAIQIARNTALGVSEPLPLSRVCRSELSLDPHKKTANPASPAATTTISAIAVNANTRQSGKNANSALAKTASLSPYTRRPIHHVSTQANRYPNTEGTLAVTAEYPSSLNV